MERAPLIRDVFELYTTGKYSFVTLMKEMNCHGLRTKKGKEISKRGIQTILRNPFYYGWFKWSGQLWQGMHKPIITKDLFDRVQQILSQKACSSHKGKWFAFKGFLKCGHCNHSITAETHKGHVYYSCTTPKKCGGYFREEKIDEMIVEALGKFRMDDETRESIRTALIESHEEEGRRVKEDLDRLQREYSRNETHKHTLYHDRLNNVVPEEFFKERFNQIQERQQEIQDEISKLNQKNINYMDEGLQILELMQNMQNQYLSADIEKKSKMLQILILELRLRDVTRVH